MEVTCPVCRKKNTSETCSRCRADISELFLIRKRADLLHKKAMHLISIDKGSYALKSAEYSWSLIKREKAAEAGFFASLLAGEFERASLWYRRRMSFNQSNPRGSASGL